MPWLYTFPSPMSQSHTWSSISWPHTSLTLQCHVLRLRPKATAVCGARLAGPDPLEQQSSPDPHGLQHRNEEAPWTVLTMQATAAADLLHPPSPHPPCSRLPGLSSSPSAVCLPAAQLVHRSCHPARGPTVMARPTLPSPRKGAESSEPQTPGRRHKQYSPVQPRPGIRCSPTYLVITISMSIFRVGYSSHAARPREGNRRLPPTAFSLASPVPQLAPR